jgi:hypothetical protein
MLRNLPVDSLDVPKSYRGEAETRNQEPNPNGAKRAHERTLSSGFWFLVSGFWFLVYHARASE